MEKGTQRNLTGFLNVNKEPGITSFDAVRRIRRLTSEKKVGHSGVLDKPATGVLPIGLGKATSLFTHFGSFEKVYLSTFLFGFSTDTDDISGRLLEVGRQEELSEGDVRTALKRFSNEILQAPPAYSSTKFHGKPSYKLAVRGKEVPTRLKKVYVERIDFIEFKSGPTFELLLKQFDNLVSDEGKRAQLIQLFPNKVLKLLTIRIFCRGGFYVRSLARDLGEITGAKGCAFSIVREQVGPFRLEKALTLAAIEEKITHDGISSVILPPGFIAEPESSLTLDEQSIARLCKGSRLTVDAGRLREELGQPRDVLYIFNSRGELALTARVKTTANKVIIEPAKVIAPTTWSGK